MPVNRLMPTGEAEDLIGLTRDIVGGQLPPKVEAAEQAGEFPRAVFQTLGRAGLLSLPCPEEFGGRDSPSRCTCMSWRRSPRHGPVSESG